MEKFRNWLNNAPVKKKFFPLSWLIILSMAFISLFSFFSVGMVNSSSERIIEDNVRNKEQLSAIIRNMYVCRVLGRDILFAEDEEIKANYYEDYIMAFDDLDNKMEEFSTHLSGSQLDEFASIIKEKNEYEASMILSADIWIGGGSYDEALEALQIVTPIANDFFGSIDEFSLEEENLMNEALRRNDDLVLFILIAGAVLNIIVILAVTLFIKFFSKNMSTSLVALEQSMSKIAETGNMKVEIPSELYTRDEVGSIASVANNMKLMLLEYSFKDTLTGGYNAKAYHEELDDLFGKGNVEKEVWCVISDMNNLKLINDELGHLEGDNAIRTSYYALDDNFHEYGKTFRMGGDEFVSLLVGCTKEELETMIANISGQINKTNTNSDYKFSLAIGYDRFIGRTIAEYHDFFKAVDKKMYDNKIASKQSRLNARVVQELEEVNK